MTQRYDHAKIVDEIKAGTNQLPPGSLRPHCLQVAAPKTAYDQNAHNAQAEEGQDFICGKLVACYQLDACIRQYPKREARDSKPHSLEMGDGR